MAKRDRKNKKPFFNYILFSLLVAGLILLSSQESWTFNNGQLKIEWLIKNPLVNLKNEHDSAYLSKIREEALKLVNRDRVRNSVSPLQEDLLLSKAAQLHAEDMLKRGFYDHITPEGKTPTDRFQAIGGKEGVGENIMQQTGNYGVRLTNGLLEEYQKGWMSSTGHRENILNPKYTHFGYGIAIDPIQGEVYAVQNFLSR